jgi:small subunit ribosomal protein S12|tara:strand:+ start:10790 stop:11164 length:375 start_codon:yes stop_codon:yes gene_type:complete
MLTLNQLLKKPRINKSYKSKSLKLKHNPQKRAVCLRVLTMAPKKPNSANRRVVKVNIIQYGTKLTAKIPGESHNLQQHSTVLLSGARARDLIGVRYIAIRGKYDLSPVAKRAQSRSRYGVKKHI